MDVAIVGAGYTGLWRAYYLKLADPSLQVVVLEAELAGFGASGRNGGWCSALYPVSLPRLAREHGRDAAVRQYRVLQATGAEVARVVAADGLSAHWAGGRGAPYHFGSRISPGYDRLPAVFGALASTLGQLGRRSRLAGAVNRVMGR